MVPKAKTERNASDVVDYYGYEYLAVFVPIFFSFSSLFGDPSRRASRFHFHLSTLRGRCY